MHYIKVTESVSIKGRVVETVKIVTQGKCVQIFHYPIVAINSYFDYATVQISSMLLGYIQATSGLCRMSTQRPPSTFRTL